MASTDELKTRLDRAGEIKDPLDRRMWVLAIITQYLAPTGIKPVLVGGGAVEFYTSGGYTTFDIDVIADSQALEPVMAELGFTKQGRHWIREDIATAIEAPGASLGSESHRVLEVQIEDMKVFVVGIEDLIIDRLNAFVHWKSKEDGRWAAHLITENQNQIDWDYLNTRAIEEKVDSGLAQILSESSNE